MNPEFCATMQAQLEELVSDLKFHRKRDSSLVEPQVFRTQLPDKGFDYQEGDYAPSVCWAIVSGEIDRRIARFVVYIVLTIWTPGTVVDGSNDIERLLFAILNIAAFPNFAGHSLQSAVEFQMGKTDDNEYTDGIQPHPYYQALMKLHFAGPGIAIRCNH